ncbi:N-acetylmuramoyl-L-alanine amidase [Streptomyces sp. NPDC005728]|uniref:peptidoglycan recognition protein family protein n=1 Tax=Streptomyces sp. NPDC005728 TaxID=3157054 RepID=UPI0033EA5362
MASPLTAGQLLAALRSEGVTVKTPHTGWTTHERDEATGKPFGPVHGVLIHHTAAHGDYEVVYTGNSALPGPRAHAYITKAGEALMCSAGRANHAGGGDPDVLNAVIDESYTSRPPATHYGEGDAGAADGNDCFYGYECENLGDGQDPWPRVQYVAMIKAAAAILRHYGWSEKSCIGHLEWSDQKIDPRGFDMVTFRADVNACLARPAGEWGAPPADQGGEDPMPKYVNLGAAEVTLKPGQDWTTLVFTTEWTDETGDHATGGSVFAKGAARFTGELNLQLSGLPAGSQLQVRQSEYDSQGAHVQDHPVGEVIGTPGDTFGKVPITGRLASGRQMRIRVKAFENAPVKITGAVLKVLVWKEN